MGDNWDTLSQLMFNPLSFPRKTDKAQYTGCSVHENNNGQATFENPMYNTNTKAAEGKVVRFDPNLNTICTMVWCLSMRQTEIESTTSRLLNMNIYRHTYIYPVSDDMKQALLKNIKHTVGNTSESCWSHMKSKPLWQAKREVAHLSKSSHCWVNQSVLYTLWVLAYE